VGVGEDLSLFFAILVYNTNWKDHLHHLEIVLKILKQNQLCQNFQMHIWSPTN